MTRVTNDPDVDAGRFFVDVDVRSTEVDGTRTVPMQVFFRYFEHLRLELGLDPRFGLREYMHDGSFWVVREQHVAFVERVSMHQRLRLYAWITKVGRSQVTMGQEAHDRDTGAVVARSWVTVLWMNADRRLARIPNGAREAASTASVPPPKPVLRPFERPEAAGSIVHPPRVHYTVEQVELPLLSALGSPATLSHRVEVRPTDIDVYRHVNAAGYVAMCEDARLTGTDLWEQPPLAQASVRYLREAVAGDVVDVAGCQNPDGTYTFVLSRGDEPLCLVATQC